MIDEDKNKPFYIEVEFSQWSSIVEEKLKALEEQHADILPGLKVKKIEKSDTSHLPSGIASIWQIENAISELQHIVDKYYEDNDIKYEKKDHVDKEDYVKPVKDNKESSKIKRPSNDRYGKWIEMTGDQIEMPTVMM